MVVLVRLLWGWLSKDPPGLRLAQGTCRGWQDRAICCWGNRFARKRDRGYHYRVGSRTYTRSCTFRSAAIGNEDEGEDSRAWPDLRTLCSREDARTPGLAETRARPPNTTSQQTPSLDPLRQTINTHQHEQSVTSNT